MDRESIIAAMARTLFLCAYADGVENGEIAGDAARGGEDWDDVAPRTYTRHGIIMADYARLAGWTEVSDPEALAEARRIADAFDSAARAHGDRNGSTAYNAKMLSGVPLGAAPIEYAYRWHSALSDTDRFAHCLAMTALGHGVGLEDDLPSGVRLPGWIHASVPHSDFGPHSLDSVRYPAPTQEE